MMNWLRNFMRGRHGPDQLTVGLIVVWCLLSFLLIFLPRGLSLLRLVAEIPVIWCLFRMLSRNETKRQMENQVFCAWWNNFFPKIVKKVNRVKDSKTHRYIKCPNCKQTLRLPKGRGKIRINCPKCSHSFEQKT